MHFITNGFKHFTKTNSSDPRQHVPLTHRMCVYVSHTGLVQMQKDSDAQLVLKTESPKI